MALTLSPMSEKFAAQKAMQAEIAFSLEPSVLRENHFAAGRQLSPYMRPRKIFIGVLMPADAVPPGIPFGSPAWSNISDLESVRLRAAFDPEAGVWVVAGYPECAVTFEADTLEHAMKRAMAIIPDLYDSRGLHPFGFAIVIDEFSSLEALDD